MDKKNNKPQIRFIGFTDPWEQRKVSDICSISTGKSNTQDRIDNGNYPFYVRSATIERSNRYLFDEEAVLTVGDGVGTGKVYHYVNGKYDLHQRVYRMYGFNNNLRVKFFYHYFANHFNKRVMAMTAKTSVDSVRYEMIAGMNIFQPLQNEQNLISDMFDDIDNLITLHQRKLDKLKIMKKSLLEKMFPKTGNTIPEIRFKHFTEPWEQRKLGQVIDDMYNGQTPSRFCEEYWNGTISWLSSGELNRGTVYKSLEKITPKGMESAHLRLMPSGTFVMAITGLEAAGTRGNCAILGFETTFNQSCMALIPNKKKLDSVFLFHWYKMIGEEYGLTFTQGTKQQSYNVEILKKLSIALPQLKEQKLISELFNNIDNLITLHQQQLEKLKNIKKSLLDKMFV
jgi:type I restriction enzyme S subunit